MVKIISLFNHKGGVSKTTTAFNLGWMLAQKGYRTLLVDADPQSNLTSLALNISDEEARERLYAMKDSNDIYSLVKDAASGRGYAVEGSKLRIISTSENNLFILPGHLQIEEFSNQITVGLSLNSSSIFEPMRNIPGFLVHALRRIADANKIDYILVDMAPSLSGLNEILLMGADYFIAPCSPDFFSENALKNLSRVIPEWHGNVASIKSDYPILNNPKFIGIIQQRYRPRRTNEFDDKNRPTQSFQKWVDRIKDTTNNEFVPALEKIGLAISKKDFSAAVKNNDPYDICYISDFNSLIAASQMRNKPVFELNSDDIKSCSFRFGASLQTALDDVQKFKETFSTLAENVIRLTK